MALPTPATVADAHVPRPTPPAALGALASPATPRVRGRARDHTTQTNR